MRRGWFRRHAKQFFQDCYSTIQTAVFVFSTEWFNRFFNRHTISIRFTTNKAQKIPDDYRKLIINWLRFNRHVSQPQNIFEKLSLTSDVGRYLLSNIANLDETPTSFECLDGRTYDTVGLKTVWARSAKSGWDKRQASLILMVFADGVSRVKPKLLLHATTGNIILQKEGHLYDKRVTVEFNKTAYNNEKVFLTQIKNEIIPAFEGRPSLFTLDAAGFHKTETVINTLKEHNIMPSMIPGGCTGLIQPLDISINFPLKEMFREEVEEYIEQEEEKRKINWTVGDRRVMTTICVGQAWEKFSVEKRSIVQKSFRNVGLTLPVDGSSDQELNIKGFTPQELDIGDWSTDFDTIVLEEHRVLGENDDDCSAIDFVE